MTAGVWTPSCPTCRYDLSATPDGRCPECGSEFMHSRLKAAHDAALAELPLGPIVFRTLGACGFVMGTAMLVIATVTGGAFLFPRKAGESWRGPFPHTDVALIACLFMLPWLIGRGPGRASPLGLAAVPTLLLLNIWLWQSHFGYQAAPVGIGALVGLGVLVFGLAVERRRTVAWMLLTPTFMLGLTGALVVLEVVRAPSTDVWTSLCDPRSGQVHAQYPLRRDEAMVVGTGLLVMSVALAGLAWPLLRRRAA